MSERRERNSSFARSHFAGGRLCDECACALLEPAHALSRLKQRDAASKAHAAGQQLKAPQATVEFVSLEEPCVLCVRVAANEPVLER